MYAGERNPGVVEQWLYQVKQYLVLQVIPVEHQVAVATLYMKDAASMWWWQHDHMTQAGLARASTNFPAIGTRAAGAVRAQRRGQSCTL